MFALQSTRIRVIVLSAGLVCCGPALGQFGDEGMRFFFDTKGVDSEAAARPAGSPLNFTNPTVVDAGRLYFYLEFGRQNAMASAQHITSIDLRIDINGPAVFTGGLAFNKNITGIDRWASIINPSPTPGSTSWTDLRTLRDPGPSYGARNVPDFATVEAQDSHFRQGDDGSSFGTTLLGYIDVARTPGVGLATVKFTNGPSFIQGVTIFGDDTVYFGFGDAGTRNWPNATSASPDAFIVPEPATAGVLLMVIVAAIRSGTRGGARRASR